MKHPQAKKPKMNKQTLLFFIAVGMFQTHPTTAIKITKTENQFLFRPIGKLIPELSYATLHLRLNITNLFQETNELCKA